MTAHSCEEAVVAAETLEPAVVIERASAIAPSLPHLLWSLTVVSSR